MFRECLISPKKYVLILKYLTRSFTFVKLNNKLKIKNNSSTYFNENLNYNPILVSSE